MITSQMHTLKIDENVVRSCRVLRGRDKTDKRALPCDKQW